MMTFSTLLCSVCLLLFCCRMASPANFTIAYVTGPNDDVNFTRYGPVISLAVEDFLATGWLTEHNIKIMYIPCSCNIPRAVSMVTEAHRKFKPDIFVGPPCTFTTIALGFYASYVDVPLMPDSSIGLGLEDKSTYTTLIRIKPPFHKLATAFKELFQFYNWKRTAILITNEWYCTYAIDGIRNGLREQSIVIGELIKAIRGLTDAQVDDYLTRCRERGRVILFCGNLEDRLKVIYRAQELGMTYPEYVIIFFDMLPDDHGSTPTPWVKDTNDGSEEKEKYKKAFYTFKQLTMSGLIGPRAERLFDRIPAKGRDPPWNTEVLLNLSTSTPWFRHPNALFLYDAVKLWMTILNETLSDGLPPPNGSMVFQKTGGLQFQGASGHVLMDDQAEREPDYWLWSYGPADDEYIPSLAINMAEPSGQRVHAIREIFWGSEGNVPPVDTPVCGFFNELCPEDTSSRTAVLIGALVGGVIIISVLAGWGYVYRQRLREEELRQMHWKIRFEDISVTARRTGSVVGLSMKSLRSSSTKGSAGKENTVAKASEQIFTEVGNYKGNPVAVLRVHKTSVPLTRQDLLELKEMRDMSHDNVTQFIGACVEPPNVCYLMSYCPKGSLQDIIEHDEIKLDWAFKTSLISDLINGMAFLHGTTLRSHGGLKSSNCLVDGRWMLKVSSYGLHAFKTGQTEDVGEYEKFRQLLWTAPEILRMSEKPRYGTQSGDTYSFGIILQEVIFRSMPFFLETMTPKEVIERVMTTEAIPFRPNMPKVDDETNPAVVDLITDCWQETSNKRPTFEDLKKRLRVINKGKKINILDTMLEKLEKYANNLEEIVEQRTSELVEEKKKTELLLYRMLPASVVQMLKQGRTVEAELYDEATIYFSDIVGFTSLSLESTPMQVVDLLNDLYTLFDDIIDQHDVYKVETIGDAYMVVSGIPKPNGHRHVGEIANLALDLLSAAYTRFRIRHRPGQGLNLRIGMHTGPCAAGVVGLTMPRYCLFGDTVNMASRMETNGKALWIHMSQAARDALGQLEGYNMVVRGEMQIKGKGIQTTYWLQGKDGFDKPLPNVEE